ncbi:VOC family protein, partial [uncultured Leptotrichia sp.]|uniref:VOC family protein n=1 Tax=uncultured Leptotrichia sp. TaxID=159271 RepID=UPI00261F0C62
MNNKNYGLNFNFITLRVKNIEKMRDYYLKLLKMKVLKDKKENGKREITLGTNTAPLIKMISFGNEVLKNDNETNVFHIAYLLLERKDLGNFLRNCAKELIKLDGVGDHNVSEAVYLTDPEGNGIEVYTDRDSNTWKWENGHVIMGTETIDLEDLLRISDNLPDFEIPENTKIGHVHLETFDLENDKDFYIKALGLEIVSKLPKAYFLSTGKYHHQFGMNQWNGKRKIPKNDNSTGVEEIYLSLVKEKFEKNFPNIKENT